MAGASAKNVDFSGVRDRGNFNPKQVAEGDYEAVITKVEDAEAKKTGDFQYIFTIKLKKFSQNSYPYYCKLAENQLWKLRNLGVAAGLNVPKRRMKFDPNKLVNKTIGVTMADDEFEGKMKSVVDAVFPVSELSEGVVDEVDDAQFDEGTAQPQLAGGDDDTAEDEAAESTKKKAKKDKAGKKDKGKKKGKKGSDGDVEDLDISDV